MKSYIYIYTYTYYMYNIPIITFYLYMFASQKQTAQHISNYEKYIMMSHGVGCGAEMGVCQTFFAGLDRWHGGHLAFSVGRNDLPNRHRISKLTAGT